MLGIEEDNDLVRLWWWPPGKGPRCQLVAREDLDLARSECQEMDAAFWVTPAFGIRCD